MDTAGRFGMMRKWDRGEGYGGHTRGRRVRSAQDLAYLPGSEKRWYRAAANGTAAALQVPGWCIGKLAQPGCRQVSQLGEPTAH